LRRSLPWIVATTAYVAMLLWLTWPLAPRSLDHLPDPVGLLGWWGWTYTFDLWFCTWALAWDVHAVFHDPWRLFQANIFFPAPDALAYSDHFLGLAPLAAPAYLASGSPVLGFNAALLGSYLLCALAMHGLVLRWTGLHGAAFAAGLVYAFNAWRLAPRFSIQVVGAFYLPLAVLFLDRWAADARRRDLAGLAACLLLQALASYYLGYAAFAAIGVALAVAAAQGRLRGRASGLAIAAVAVAAAAVVALSGPYIRLSAGGTFRAPTLAELAAASAAFGLIGPALAGWGALLVAVVGTAVPHRSGARGLCIALVAVGTLLAMGPTLSFRGMELPLPYRWLLDVVPGLSVVRYPIRFASIVILGFSGLVGLGLAAVAPRWPIAQRGAMAAVIAVLVWHAGATTRMAVARAPESGSAVYRTLAGLEGGGVLLEYPLADQAPTYREPEFVLHSTSHWKTLINGYSGHTPPTWNLVLEIARGLPSPTALQKLVDLTRLRWVIVHGFPNRPPAPWTELEGVGAVRRLDADAQAILYEVVLPRTADLTERARRAVLEKPRETLLGTPLTPLGADALRASWDAIVVPDRLRARQQATLRVGLRNESGAVWPGYGVRDDGLVVAVARWLPADGPRAAVEAGTIRLLDDVAPGVHSEVTARLVAPAKPGRYALELSLRQLGVDGASGAPHVSGETVVAP
jgi:hypothetical protein